MTAETVAIGEPPSTTTRAGVALVTGASRGVGRAIALKLARQGFDVAVGYATSDDAAAAVVGEVEGLGRRAVAVRSDLRAPDGAAILAAEAREALGPVRVVVSNATGYPAGTTIDELARGVDPGLGLTLGMPLEHYSEIFQARVLAFLALARATVPAMPEGGSLIAITSTGTRGYMPGYGPTGAAMAAVECVARYLAVELGPRKIRVNVASGGLIRTDALNLLGDVDKLTAYTAKHTPLGRAGEPEDLADVVAFLASNDARWITGQVILADGGAVILLNPRLEGRVAFITGGASGIGAATALRLGSEGARVVVADIADERARAVAAEVEGAWVHCDVTDVASIRGAVADGERELGPIDILVNNAGGDRFAMFVDTAEADWDQALTLNLRSTIAVTHAVLGAMQSRRSGAIISVASEAGRMGTAAGAIYSAAKAGVIGFTKAIARESAAFGVRVNAVAPGPIDTPLLNDSAAAVGEFGARIRQGMINATTMRRVGTPEEVAAAIAFLASGDASFLTGQTIAVSGGLSML